MTIEKGQPWGRAGTLPPGAPVARADAEAAQLLTQLRGDGSATPHPVIGLVGGDLARTCGAPGRPERLSSAEARELPVDLGEAVVDGERHYFVAHLVARRRWWRGRTVAVMNAEFVGSWDVAPRSHPNDGRLDVVEATLGWRDRIKARRRLATGSHLPHPGITVRRVEAVAFDLDAGTRVWIDGEPIGRARTVDIRVIPDAWSIII